MRITHGLFSGGESVFSELPAHRKIELMEVRDDCFVRSLKLRFFFVFLSPMFFFHRKNNNSGEVWVDFFPQVFLWVISQVDLPFFDSAVCLRDGK